MKTIKILILFLFIKSFYSYSSNLSDLYTDFLSTAWNQIIKWECPKYDHKAKRCVNPCIHHKNKVALDEWNCYGVTLRSNFDFLSYVIKEYANAEQISDNLVAVRPLEKFFIDIYFKKYYLPFKKYNKCTRFLLFDIAVLSGVSRSKKIARGKESRDEIARDFKIFLSKLKTFKKYGNGWYKRIDRVMTCK